MQARLLSIIVACGLMLVLMIALPAAAENPLLGGEAQKVERSGVSLTSPLAPVTAFFVKLQRDFNRKLGAEMRAIRDGADHTALWLAMLGGLLYGAFHAAGPGHGKAVVASYFLSRDARIGRGLLMGAQISLTHVISAVLVVAALRYLFGRWGFGNIEDIREIKLASYALIAATGLTLLWRALLARGSQRARHEHHHHGSEAMCCSPADSASGNAVISTLVGMVPCTGALLVMVYAFANDIVVAGALVALSIAVGMAATMSLIGMTAVFGRRRIAIAGTGSAAARRILSTLDILGPAAIAALGAGLFLLTY